MNPDSVHLSYELTRRQRLVSHVGIWLGYWPGFILMLAVPAVVFALAVLKSPWFLLILLLPPMLNNFPRFVAGFVNPLLFGAQRMDLVIEEDRIGYQFGRERKWLAFEEVDRVERFGDVWAILSSEAVIDIPVASVDERRIARIRSTIGKGRAMSGRPAAGGEPG